MRRPGWLLPLLGALLVLAFVYWALGRRDRAPATPALTPESEQMKNALPGIPEPRVPEQPVLPEVPQPALPEAQQLGAAPGAEPPEPAEPERAAAAMGAAAFPACAEATFQFTTDDPSLGDADRAKLDGVAKCLKENPSQKVLIEGRAQPVAGRTDERTDALAMHRARTIGNELERLGVPSSQLRTIGAAPFCMENDAECSARNRSVTITAAD